MKKFIYLLCFIGFSSIQAQTEVETEAENESETIQTPKEITGSYLTFNILAPIALETPRYRFGYIQPLGGKWMVGVDVGYGDESSTVSILDRIEREDYNLYEFRAEFYYQLPVARNSIHYLSLEAGYLNHQEVLISDFYKEETEGIRISYESANYERIRSALTLKYGAFFDLWDQVGLNVYYGIGIRRRNNNFTNIVAPIPEVSSNDEPNPQFQIEDEFRFGEGYFRQEGIRYGLNFQLGFKLYYNFK